MKRKKRRKAKLPWDYSTQPAAGEGVPNVPTPEGRALGKELARLTELGFAKMKRDFPSAPGPCAECAFVAGTIPNGCAETVADALKCAVEGHPFYCHKGMKNGEPQRLCAGWCAATEALEVMDSVKAIEKTLAGGRMLP